APDHIACTAAETGESLTREELLRRAGAIAATVRDLGNGDEVVPASPVIACLENGPMLTAVFAASILGDFPIALLGPATSDAEIADAAARLHACLLISRRAIPALCNIDPWSI